MLKIGITGHRDLVNEAEVREDIRQSFLYFKFHHDAAVTGISSLAEGADLIFAEEAMREGVPLEVLLPFPPDEYVADFSTTSWQRVTRLIAQSASCRVRKTHDGAPAASRNKSYLQTGQQLVDESDIVLTVWDGHPAQGKGGTGDIVQYALQQKKPVHIIKGVRTSHHEYPVPHDKMLEDFRLKDAYAIRYKNRFRRTWSGGIIAGLAAVFLFAFSQAFHPAQPWHFIFSLAEISFLLLSFVLLAIYARKWKAAFLTSRRDAEKLRGDIWHRGIDLSALSAQEQAASADIAAAEALNREAAEAGTTEQLPSAPDNLRRAAWCLANKQVEYHQQYRMKPFQHRMQIVEHSMEIIKIIFFIVAPLSFIREVLEYTGADTGFSLQAPQPYFLFLSLTLPPLYAALEGVKYFSEWKRDIAVSAQTVTHLEKIKEGIMKAGSAAALSAETMRLKETLEIENADWAIRYEEKEVGPKI